MPRQQQPTTGAPFAKLVEIGDTLVGAWGGSTRKQQRDYETGTPKWKPARDGEPQIPLLEEVNWFVAMPGITAATGKPEDGYEPITPGDVVRFSFSGFKWHNVIEARKALPAIPEFDVRKSREASSDVYTISLLGWSKQTTNAAGATKAGYTVVENRIILRSDEEADRLVAKLRKEGGNTTLGKDLAIEVRRFDPSTEQKWADLADELWDSAPWEAKADTEPARPAAADDGDPGPAAYDDDEEPF